MPVHPLPPGPAAPDARLWTAGIWVSSECRRISAAVVTATGQGFACRVEIVAAARAAVPSSAVSLFDQLPGEAVSPGLPAELAAQLSEIQISLLDDVLGQAGLPRHHVLAVGVHDPGIWSTVEHAPPRYLGLCDSARLAEATGLTVFDSFPARDLAQGGLGGPLAAIPEWILLHDFRRTRVVAHLERTSRLMYLPAGGAAGVEEVMAFDVGPGGALLDRLAARLTGGVDRYDAGGHLAVQGRKIPELLDHWLAHPYFEQPLPRWQAHGVPPEPFFDDAMRLAVQNDWSVRDVLCTATHFAAEAFARSIRRHLPLLPGVDELIPVGGGQANGLLLRELTRCLPETRVVRLAELGIDPIALEPATAALLATFAIQHVAANPTGITGASVPRVLGRVTPGAPSNWNRVLEETSRHRPAVMPLRRAV